MYSKVINPEKDGKVAFSNKGSALRLGNYLEKELDVETNPEGKIFFNNQGDFTKEEMVAALDNNVKGLTAQDDKFYSLVLSPSQAELEHIGNDTQKLRAFTLACMDNYAQNFQLKSRNGVARNLNEKDLVWFANIEHDRTYKGDDPEVKSGIKKQGETKEGLQTHIHITVSARDAGMKITLNPRTNDKNRFSILAFAEKNQKTFNEAFGYEGSQKISFKNENKQGWNKVMAVEKQLITFEEKYGLPSSDCHHLRYLAIEKEYSNDFRQQLKELGKELKNNDVTNGLSQEQWEKVLGTQKDDRTREGRLERVLTKFKEDFNLSEESEKAIRQIGEAKELSSDFFTKLGELQKSWEEQAKLDKEELLKVQILSGQAQETSPKSLSTTETETLLAASLDDRTREGRLERVLTKFKEDFNLSEESEKAIRQIGEAKELSSNFFTKLGELQKSWEERAKLDKEELLKVQILEGKEEGSKNTKYLNIEEYELLKSASLDDRTREGRLERVLTKFKEEFHLSVESEQAIRKIGEAKELSSDFFEKLQKIQESWQEQAKLEKENQIKTQTVSTPKSKYLTIEEYEILTSAVLDDRTREGRLERTLEKFKENYLLSDKAIETINVIGIEKGLSNDFFDKLFELEKILQDESRAEKEATLREGLNLPKPTSQESIDLLQPKMTSLDGKKDLSEKHIELLSSAIAFEQPSPTFDLIASMQKSFQFFKGAEMSESDMQEMENSLHRAGSHLKKRVKRHQQHLPQSPEKGMSL